MNRRVFIHSGAAALATAALPSALVSFGTSTSLARNLRVGYFDLDDGPIFKSAATQILNELVAKGVIGSYEILPLPIGFQLPKMKSSGFDVIATSPSFHTSLPVESQYFGTLPGGLVRSEKSAWLLSSAGQNALEKVFSPFGVHPIPIGVASDSYGFLSKHPLNRLHDLSQRRVAIFDDRSAWYRARGAQPIEPRPLSEILPLFAAGGVDLTDLLGHERMLRLLEQFPVQGNIYYVTQKMRTALSAHLLFDVSLWKMLNARGQQVVTEVQRKTFEANSEAFAALSSVALEKLKSRLRVLPLPNEIESSFTSFSRSLTRKLARQSPFAGRLSVEYEKFRSLSKA